MAEEIQKKLQKELDAFKGVQKDFNKAINQRKLLDGQLNENKAVKDELELIKKDAQVYKLIGPVLVKQDLEEARQNVTKRMEYISKELKRVDDVISTLDKSQESHTKILSKLQQEYQQAQLKAAVKS